MRAIRSVPIQLRGKRWPEVLEARGEVFMTRRSFEALNHRAAERGDKTRTPTLHGVGGIPPDGTPSLIRL